MGIRLGLGPERRTTGRRAPAGRPSGRACPLPGSRRRRAVGGGAARPRPGLPARVAAARRCGGLVAPPGAPEPRGTRGQLPRRLDPVPSRAPARGGDHHERSSRHGGRFSSARCPSRGRAAFARGIRDPRRRPHRRRQPPARRDGLGRSGRARDSARRRNAVSHALESLVERRIEMAVAQTPLEVLVDGRHEAGAADAFPPARVGAEGVHLRRDGVNTWE